MQDFTSAAWTVPVRLGESVRVGGGYVTMAGGWGGTEYFNVALARKAGTKVDKILGDNLGNYHSDLCRETDIGV